MKNKLLLLLVVLFAIPGISTAAEPHSHTLEIEFSFTASDDPSKNLLGYNLYKEGVQVCQVADSTATNITCDVLTEDGTFNFTLTGYYSDNTESPHSPPFPFTIDQTSITLLAVAGAAPASGEVPLSVSFEGAGSTGTISTYSWNFGDGGTATGSASSYTYLVPGTYSATLTVTDANGATSEATTTITALASTTPPEPPTAVLTSSTAAGEAPLPVAFDGSLSTTPNPPMVQYHWKFGDGAEAAGATATASHVYSTAGTYQAELTVTDNLGLTDTVQTPVVVIGSVPANEKPTAIITATGSTEGEAPLLTSFDGSQSSDPDGSIESYDWNFGDGTGASGQNVQHTYTEAGTYTLSLKVTDNLGETATVTKQVVCSTALPKNIVNFEAGEVSVDSKWGRVDIENTFINPVVIAGPPTVNYTDPVLVRIRNVTPDSFEIRLQEWDYLDDEHGPEILSYIVIEKGIYALDSGTKIEVGSFTGASRFQKISLQQPYDLVPVILTQVITENDAGAVTGRIQNSGQSSFDYKLQEEEVTKNAHADETVGYIAWEPGKEEIGGLLFETGHTPESITNKWSDISFQDAFPASPLFIADMQTYEDRDSAALRTRNISPMGTQIMAEEEQSKNSKVNHGAEVVGYLVIGSATE